MTSEQDAEAADAWRERLDELRAAVAASDGRRIFGELRMLRRTMGIAVKNSQDLLRHLDFLGSPEGMEIWSVERRDLFEAFRDEAVRLLHNYLASMNTLVDQTRRITEQLVPDEDDQLRRDVQERIQAEFIDDGRAQFLKGLRNFILHRSLPMTSGQLNWSREDGFNAAFLLDRSHLLEWTGWNAVAKEFVDAQPDGVDIRSAVSEYQTAATNLTVDIEGMLAERFKVEVAATNELIRLMNRHLSGGR